MANVGLVAKHRLSAEDIVQVRGLAAACCQSDNVRIKFNWELMLDRDGTQAEDFCWYEAGRIVGYVQTDGFGDEFEVTGAVMPAYRERGIFRRLFEAARAEVRQRGSRQILLVSYPRCPAGTIAARRLGATYRFSEYRMEAEASAVPPLPDSELRLEEVTPDGASELSQIMGASFGGAQRGPDALRRELQTPGRRYFLARLGPETVGQIGVVVPPDGAVYLRAIGILPEQRRQGHGRQMLAALVHHLMAEGHAHFALDVEAENAGALSLYQACGFHETMAYDYSHVPST